MNIQTILLKFIMLANVYTMCVSLERNLRSNQRQNEQQPNEIAKKSESIPNGLDAVQKEPKFFDEFERKYRLHRVEPLHNCINTIIKSVADISAVLAQYCILMDQAKKKAKRNTHTHY